MQTYRQHSVPSNAVAANTSAALYFMSFSIMEFDVFVMFELMKHVFTCLIFTEEVVFVVLQRLSKKIAKQKHWAFEKAWIHCQNQRSNRPPDPRCLDACISWSKSSNHRHKSQAIQVSSAWMPLNMIPIIRKADFFFRIQSENSLFRSSTAHYLLRLRSENFFFWFRKANFLWRLRSKNLFFRIRIVNYLIAIAHYRYKSLHKSLQIVSV